MEKKVCNAKNVRKDCTGNALEIDMYMMYWEQHFKYFNSGI